MSETIKKLSKHGIHSYGSPELLRFEKQMERYFTREYARWEGNKEPPEKYGVSSFEGAIEGDIDNEERRDVAISHYDDESYQFYQLFLDHTYMSYTMAYYGATNNSPEPDNITLEQAQINKFEQIINRADIKNGQTILDLGCGFGGFSKYLLNSFTDINIIAITPSDVQVNYIKNNLISKNSKLYKSRFKIINKYFNEKESIFFNDRHFDRVVSIGMLEHVSNIDLLSKTIARILKDDGKCFFHCIVSADTIPYLLNSKNSLIDHYFPGTHIWPYHELQRHDRHLHFVDSWFLNGMNYWKTLDTWHQRFWGSIEHLSPEYLSTETIEKWNKYFSLCKVMFSPNNGKSYGNGQYLYEKKICEA